MIKKSVFSIAIILINSFFVACNSTYFDDGFEDFVWRGDIKTPITRISFTTLELLKELKITDIDNDSNGNLIFTHSDTINVNADGFDVTFPEINIYSEIPTPNVIINNLNALGLETFIIPKGSVLIKNIISPTQTIYKKFIAGTKELTSANFDTGILNIKLNSSFDNTTDLTIVIPTISNKEDGTIYSTTINLPGNSLKSINIPLKEYNADFTYDQNGGGKTFNSFYAQVNAVLLYKEGNRISKTSKIILETRLINVNAETLYGNFKNEQITSENYTLNFDSFNELKNGTINFENASINLKLKNAFGFPIGIDLVGIKAYDGEVELSHLTYSGIQQTESTFDSPNKVVINALSSIESIPSDTQRIFDKDNSNINELISSKPSSIDMIFSGSSNPSELSLNKNFYSKNNDGLEIIMYIEVPIDLQIENLVIEQDEKDLILGEEIDLIEKITFGIKTVNNIPLSGKVSIIFLNNGTDLELTKSINTFTAAPVNNIGQSNGTKTTTTEVQFSDKELEKLKDATHIKTAIIFDTPLEKNSVKFVATNYIKTNITATIGISSVDIIK
jgi:hypothetical protein